EAQEKHRRALAAAQEVQRRAVGKLRDLGPRGVEPLRTLLRAGAEPMVLSYALGRLGELSGLVPAGELGETAELVKRVAGGSTEDVRRAGQKTLERLEAAGRRAAATGK
ncbi:MAG: hypothetical protein L0216_16705, partial [Planctomycetales bacterium]|nr:hypothetical protein [Planctomycetales bacterium]